MTAPAHTRELPKCPVCESTSKRCKRPSGHEADTWHVAREDELAQLCRCETCIAWLTRRGLVATKTPSR